VSHLYDTSQCLSLSPLVLLLLTLIISSSKIYHHPLDFWSLSTNLYPFVLTCIDPLTIWVRSFNLVNGEVLVFSRGLELDLILISFFALFLVVFDGHGHIPPSIYFIFSNLFSNLPFSINNLLSHLVCLNC